MATSPSRRNRHRRRKAAGLVAAGAAAAMMAGTLTAPPANAALFPLSLGSIGDVAPDVLATCDAGDPEVAGGLLDSSADCTNSSQWLFTPIADAVLGFVAPDIAELISVGGLNGALATSGLELDLSLLGGSNVVIPGHSTISGSGYSTAITLFGGEARANSDYLLAAAIAVAAAGGIASADSLFGVSVATAIGRPATQVDVWPLPEFGSERVENSAKARSLPLGIAIANSSLTPEELITGVLTDVDEYRTSSLALGGIAAAYRSIDDSKGAVCTAVYAEARVHQNDERTDSCTGVLFIFQKQQSSEGGNAGLVVYAIKNPFDVGFVSPYGDNLAGLLSGVTSGALNLGPLNDILAGKFVPEFQSDIIRMVMTDDGPKFETDLPEWIGGLFGSNNANMLLANSPQTQSQGESGPTAFGASVDDSVKAAPLQVNEPAQIPEAVVEEPAPLPELTYNVPPAEEPVVEAPQAEEQAPPDPAPAQEAPVLDGAGSGSTEDAGSDADLVLN